MAPPTGSEQLIRDYLNRLAVAARDLSPDERRALLERTRSLIDQKADLARRPSTMDVGRVLARLGDPARLAEQERRRLTAQGRSAQPATQAAPAPQRFLPRVRSREHRRVRGPSFRWPAQSASQGGVPRAPSSGEGNGVHQPGAPAERDAQAASAVGASPAAVPEARAAPSAPAQSAPAPSAPAPSPPASAPSASGTVSADLPEPADGPPSASSPAPANGTAHGTPAPPAASRASGFERGSQDAVTGAETAAASQTAAASERAAAADPRASAASRAAATDRPEESLRRSAAELALRPASRQQRQGGDAGYTAPGSRVRRQLGRLAAWTRKRPLEAAVIVLMGIGGPIFPPVFVVGATLALASEWWDGRDKWVGLALPVVLIVIGLAVGVAAGGRAHWMHEGWVYLDVVSRLAPALGAGYLAWRCQYPRRPAAVPPFSRPRRVS